MKRTPLLRRTPLRARSGLKRTSELAAMSKRAKAKVAARRALVKRLLLERPVCQACHKARSTDVHERITRARGGSILDPSNCLAICRRCHDWIHDHPKEALERGLLAHSWENPNV